MKAPMSYPLLSGWYFGVNARVQHLVGSVRTSVHRKGSCDGNGWADADVGSMRAPPREKNRRLWWAPVSV